jgi:cell wall-associated NlpC family hydrolase
MMGSKKIISWLLCLVFLATVPNVAVVGAANDINVENYNKYYPTYQKHDKVLADAFLKNYNGSEAQALVARAIWYMENGYMVYGHSKYWDTGFIDCSNFVSLVYKDFGYKIPTASRKYDQVGKVIEGVYSRKIKGSTKYELVGTEKLRPGDIFTFWKQDTTGNGTHIGHVAIYMGEINGHPAVIQTNAERPTAIGIRTDFRFWYGEHFLEARRVLDDASQQPGKAWEASPPVIPAQYQLKPQKPVVMPEEKYMSSQGSQNVPNAAGQSVAKDIAGHWAEEDIKKLLDNKSMEGYPNGTFAPDKAITRAEFVTVLVKAFKVTSDKGKEFSDTYNHWAGKYIAAAESNNIVSGYSSRLFGPEDSLTREQMALMIVKAVKLDNSDPDEKKTAFTDEPQISDWAKQAVLVASAKNILTGYPDHSFKPQGTLTRAEAATVIVKALNLTK